jgi:hypothetical protein
MPEPEKHENQVSAIKIAGEFKDSFSKVVRSCQHSLICKARL